MTEKLSLYDALAGLAPGVLLVSWIAILFPSLGANLKVALPDAFVVVALLAASLLGGILVQTLGSMFEGILHKAFGGRPSDLALRGTLGERYLPKDAADKIRVTLTVRFGQASDRSLFLRAMSEAESIDTSKARIFNAQYGYLRSIAFLLLLAIPLLLGARAGGRASSWAVTPFVLSIVALILLLVLFSWRAWQRGAYYVREVLLTAERLIDRPVAPPAVEADRKAAAPT